MIMRVSQISIGRFHHFHLARQLEQRGWLEAIHTGYPRFKLRDETGIPPEKIRSFPWLQGLFMARERLGLTHPWLAREWAWLANNTLDRHVTRFLSRTDVLVALSGAGLYAGRAIHRMGGRYICDRASSHIRYQDEILREEYARWGAPYFPVDSRVIAKEELEYEQADRVVVPSKFVRDSFLEKGVSGKKVICVPFGARLERFHPIGEPVDGEFNVLFVGQVGLRKGIPDLLTAFAHLRHPRKRLVIVGSMQPEIPPLLGRFALDGVEFVGIVPNARLAELYSRAHVLVLPSIEEGLSYVQGEALACGCPVIATPNAGAENLFTNGQEGFIVPIRRPEAICEKLEQFAQDPALARAMGEAGLARVRSLGGWDIYGDQMAALLCELAKSSAKEGE